MLLLLLLLLRSRGRLAAACCTTLGRGPLARMRQACYSTCHQQDDVDRDACYAYT